MTDIHPTAIIAAGAELGKDVKIGPYCVVGAKVQIGDRTWLKSHVALDGTTKLGPDCTVYPFASIGAPFSETFVAKPTAPTPWKRDRRCVKRKRTEAPYTSAFSTPSKTLPRPA